MCRLTPTRMSGHSSTARMADRIGITAMRCAKYPWPDATIRPTTTQTMLTSDEMRDLMTAPRTADRVVNVHPRIPGAELAESGVCRTAVLADMRAADRCGARPPWAGSSSPGGCPFPCITRAPQAPSRGRPVPWGRRLGALAAWPRDGGCLSRGGPAHGLGQGHRQERGGYRQDARRRDGVGPDRSRPQSIARYPQHHGGMTQPTRATRPNLRSRREARAGPTGRSDLTSVQPLAHPSRAVPGC